MDGEVRGDGLLDEVRTLEQHQARHFAASDLTVAFDDGIVTAGDALHGRRAAGGPVRRLAD